MSKNIDNQFNVIFSYLKDIGDLVLIFWEMAQGYILISSFSRLESLEIIESISIQLTWEMLMVMVKQILYSSDKTGVEVVLH